MTVQSARAAGWQLENNSADVGKRRRHRFEHAIHQVWLTVEMPAAIHRSLRLDRVEPSYRFSRLRSQVM